jgi:hypothetical protein
MRIRSGGSDSGEAEDGLEPLRLPHIGHSVSVPLQDQDFGVAEGFEVQMLTLPPPLLGARVFWGVFSRVPVFGPAPFAIGCHAVGVLVEFAAE